MPLNEQGWDVNEAGNIIVFPLADFRAATMYGAGCLVRLEVSTRQTTPQKADTTFQVGMTVEQAKSLILVLQQMVDQIEAPPTTQRGTSGLHARRPPRR